MRFGSKVIFAAALVLPCGSALAQNGPALTIDGAAARHPISDMIYGTAEYGLDPGFQQKVKLPVTRWGGDATTRYNWMVDSSNAGFDFYFVGGNFETNPTPSGGPDELVLLNQSTGTQTLLTIPIIPYINSTSAFSCSFPQSIYGAQMSYDPYVKLNGTDPCGNSLAASNGAQLADANILANHVPNAPAIQAAWVQHLIGRFGTAAKGGVRFYQMDNEPFGWANTHRDVQPAQPTYDTIEMLTESYAAAVKQADPSALMMGPSDFGWPAYLGNGPEIAAHNGVYNAPWYLSKLAQYQAAHGVRLLDYFDEHYYPANDGTDAGLLDSTRSFWDTTFKDPSYIGTYYGAVYLIPRMKGWVAQNYPGTKIAISEYSVGAHERLIGALAQADVLGIFGRESVDFATMWDSPQVLPQGGLQPVAFSFYAFRNYDGHRHAFGDLSVQATSANQSQVSVYAALRKDQVLTAVLINKTLNAVTSSLGLANLTPSGPGRSYVYSGADLTAIHTGPAVSFTSGSASVTVPAQSITVIAVPLSGTPYSG